MRKCLIESLAAGIVMLGTPAHSLDIHPQSGGCYLRAEIISPLDDQTGMYGEGVAQCLDAGGGLVSETGVKVGLIVPVDESLVGTKIFVHAKDINQTFANEYQLTQTNSGFVGRTENQPNVQIKLAPRMDLGSPTLVINALEELPLVRVAGGHGHGGGVNRMTGRGSIYTVRPEEKAESYYGYGRGNNSGGDKARAPVVHRDGGSRRP